MPVEDEDEVWADIQLRERFTVGRWSPVVIPQDLL